MSHAPSGIDHPQNDSIIWKLETDIDDCSGEQLGFVMDLLFDAGAWEVHYAPIFMKKNRPGYQVEVICDEDAVRRIEDVLFEQTTTIGIRRIAMQRTVLDRRLLAMSTPWGTVQGKQVTLPDGRTRIYPEYESVMALSRESGVAYADIYHAAYATKQ
ncbi:MAG: DUF111 family protein [Limosilactobacillus mucosae]|nr:DUF111 family protein [Limosilactobacillus mucosae]